MTSIRNITEGGAEETQWVKVGTVIQGFRPAIKGWSLVWQQAAFLLGIKKYAPHFESFDVHLSFWAKKSKDTEIFAVTGAQGDIGRQVTEKVANKCTQCKGTGIYKPTVYSVNFSEPPDRGYGDNAINGGKSD